MYRKTPFFERNHTTIFANFVFVRRKKRGYGPTCSEVGFRNLIDFYGDNLFRFI